MPWVETPLNGVVAFVKKAPNLHWLAEGQVEGEDYMHWVSYETRERDKSQVNVLLRPCLCHSDFFPSFSRIRKDGHPCCPISMGSGPHTQS